MAAPQVLPGRNVSRIQSHLFRIYDTDGDGYIDFVEFVFIFHVLSAGEPVDILEKLFRSLVAQSALKSFFYFNFALSFSCQNNLRNLR